MLYILIDKRSKRSLHKPLHLITVLCLAKLVQLEIEPVSQIRPHRAASQSYQSWQNCDARSSESFIKRRGQQSLQREKRACRRTHKWDDNSNSASEYKHTLLPRGAKAREKAIGTGEGSNKLGSGAKLRKRPTKSTGR